MAADSWKGNKNPGTARYSPPFTEYDPSSPVPAPSRVTFPVPTSERLMPLPRTTIRNEPPMIRKRTFVPRHVVVVSFFSTGGKSSPVTIGPVPSPSIGSLIVTEPRAKLPITPPRAEIVIVPRPLCTDSVPSLAPWSRAAEAAGRASAASMAKVRSALITSQYRPFNCVLHHWNVRRL